MAATVTTATEYEPTFEDDETLVTAGEIRTGDWLVEIVRARGIPHLLVEHLVLDIVEGPSHHGITDGDPANLGRVRLTLFDGRRPLLPVGHPVVVRRRVS